MARGTQQDQVRWLEPEERQTWIALVALMTRLPAALDAELQRESGLTLFEYVVLAHLSERPRRTARMSGLAALVNGSLSRLSHVARRLEKRGLLGRRPDPDDGRFTLATLTDEGLALVQQVAPGHVGHVRELVFDSLGADHVVLRQAAVSILQAVDPDAVASYERQMDAPDED